MSEFNYKQYRSNLSLEEKKYAPDTLFVEGEADLLLEGVKVSVVGSRKASEEGLRRAKILTQKLLAHNIIVVSGLAAGIDTIAHETAIAEGGRTIAVLGTPLDKAYPSSNKALLNQIKQDHLAISQFPLGYPTKPQNFPMRNRTMALVSDATVIVEASQNSGTRHQGWEALRLGRSLFIMENVATNPSLSWPKEMMAYGAQVLVREGLDEILENIPNYTYQLPISLVN